LEKGNNIYSWIHEDDLVNSILFLVKNKKSGTYNLVAPNPVSSKLFTIEISKILNKKIFFPPVPKKIIKLFTGSMSELFLFSQDVSSNKLKSEGFEFKFNKLSPALRDLLK
jgi:NAD dependent epimerase/dehydratase family enzyme